MKWNFIISGAPLGCSDPSAGYAPRRKEWITAALAGAGLASSLASTIFGGASASKQQREAERRLAEEKARNDAWYNRRYNESYSDTSAGQNMIRMAKEAARENWKREAGAAAVAGGTDAAAAMAKEAGNRMVGDAIAKMAETDTARKDNIDASYRAENSRLTQQQIALDQQKAQNTAAVASGVSDALMKGAQFVANVGSPGGGGVDPAEKTGISGNEKWEKLPEYNDNYKMGSIYARNPKEFFGL